MPRPFELIAAPLLLAGLGSPAIAATGDSSDDLRATIAADMPRLMDFYRDLHSNPELSFEEVKTAAKLAAEARKLGFAVTEKVGRTGVVAVMRNGPGPTVLVRTDMDALPVVEQTGLPFASKVRMTTAAGVETGVMHACGHDTHMTTWIEVAKLLAAHKDKWSGTLVMIGQPAEEVGLGAAAMLADGLFTRFPHPDYALAFHDSAQNPAGQIAYTPGFALANVDSVDIDVKGVGGHGAYPQTTRDPIVLASAIVMRLQTLVSRETNPLDPAVVTVGSFHAGAKHNVISDEAKLQLTVRSYTDAERKLLLDGIARIAKGEAIAAGMPEDKLPVVTVESDFTPATYNDPDFTQKAMAVVAARFPAGQVRQAPPVMGGEDFSQYRRADPDHLKSLIFWVGGERPEKIAAAANGGPPLPSLHSPLWAPDAEKVIGTAAEAMTAAVLSLMPPAGG